MTQTTNKGLRLFILLCSDLAIRSGTAARIAPQHYNHEHQLLTFVTKGGANMTIPVTDEIRALLESCKHDSAEPYVQQLWHQSTGRKLHGPNVHIQLRQALRKHSKAKGIVRRITLHDLRRTTAVAVYRQTGDLRRAQAVLGHQVLRSTLHYLDHDVQPISRELLETIKRPAWAERKLA